MKSPHISLVVPTYNECLNIAAFLQSAQDALRGSDFEIIVVDDNSPDETASIVRSLAATNRRIRLVVRTHERGLSAAVLEGMRVSKGDILAVMDADLSHDERILPQMVQAVESGAALAVASRRIPGGGADRWPWHRRLFSNVATILTRAVLRTSLSDPMSGYFVIPRSAYEQCKHRLNPQGYKILLEFYERGRPEKVSEHPFIFKDRHQGHSKLTLQVMIQFLKGLWRLRAESSS